MSLVLTCLQAKAAASTAGPSPSGNQTQEVNNDQDSQRGQGDNDEIHNEKDPLSLLGRGDPGTYSCPCTASPQRQKSLPFKPQLPRPRSNLFNDLLRSQGDDQDVQGDNDGGDVDKFGYPSNKSACAAALHYPGGYVPADEASRTTLHVPSSLAQHTDSCHSCHGAATTSAQTLRPGRSASSGDCNYGYQQRARQCEVRCTTSLFLHSHIRGQSLFRQVCLYTRGLSTGPFSHTDTHTGARRGDTSGSNPQKDAQAGDGIHVHAASGATDNAHNPQPTLFYPPPLLLRAAGLLLLHPNTFQSRKASRWALHLKANLAQWILCWHVCCETTKLSQAGLGTTNRRTDTMGTGTQTGGMFLPEISLPPIQSFNVFQPNDYNVHGLMPSFQGTGPALPAPLARHQPLPAVAVFGSQPLAYPPQLPVHHAQIPSSHYPSLPHILTTPTYRLPIPSIPNMLPQLVKTCQPNRGKVQRWQKSQARTRRFGHCRARFRPIPPMLLSGPNIASM
ncbi:hypothetical protein BT96DRAFT_996172 [Gymnopus androsaceus JB14]|uniref:Uncharacterized protein n=1 Tax=Gymnopus androsaceus JB14 TaxID=1447944 RepID=A0A6A4HHE5_9AGAR|nr:hypothetical protein BT96DRAFT_996172 [Gymnopus androsaceus JB14]